MPRAVRSVLAVLAGYISMAVAVGLLTFACILALHLKSGHPTPVYLAVNLVYSGLAAILGGWVTAKIAGYKPVRHGIALGLLIMAVGVAFLLHPAPGQPLWYQWALTLLAPPLAVLGAALARRSSSF